MKTIFILTLIFTLSTASYGRSEYHNDEGYDHGQGCEVTGYSDAIREIQSVFKVDCLKYKQKESKRCDCLAETARDNYVVKAQLNETDDKALKEKRAEAKAKLTNQFMDVYSQMTIESVAQTQLLKLDDNKSGPVVGCPASEISKNVRKAVDDAQKDQVKALVDVKNRKEELLKNCGKHTGFLGGIGIGRVYDCDSLKTDISRIDDQLKSLKPAKNSCSEAIAFLRSAPYKKVLMDVKARWSNDKKNLSMLSLLEKMLKDDKATDEMMTNAMSLVSRSLGMIGYDVVGESPCTMVVNAVNEEVQKQIADNNKSGKFKTKDTTVANCEVDDHLCKTVDNVNKLLQQKFGEKFAHDAQKECVSFAEFKAYKGMPGAAMMGAIGSSERSARRMLEMPTDPSDPLYAERVRFMRANPVIGKLAATKDGKEKLGAALNKLANSLPAGAKESDRLRAYLGFMKGPVKDLVNNLQMKNTEQIVCKTMTDNFTAIQVAQDIPGMTEEDPTDPMALLFKAISQCRVRNYNKNTITNLDSTLKASPIFTLGAPDAQKEEENLDNEFDAYKKNHCGDYPQKIAQCQDKSEKGIEKCRDEYNGTNPDAAFAQTSKVINDADIEPSMTGSIMEKIADFTNLGAQDQGFKDYWYKTVAPNMPGPIAYRGQENDYQKNSASSYEKVASTKVPERYRNSTRTASSSGEATTRAPASVDGKGVNEGQEQPSFLNQPSDAQGPVPSPFTMNPAQISNATSVQQLNPQFPQMKPEEKVKYLNSLQDYAETLPNNEEVQDKLNLPEELEDATDELAELEKANKKAEQEVKNTPKAVTQNTTSGAVSTPSSNIAGMYPMMSSGGINAARKVNIDPVKKKKDGVNDAINSIHELQAPGRDVASVNGDLSIVIQKSDADPKTLTAPYQVSEEISAGSTADYLVLKQDANKLAEFIASKIDPSKVKDAQIIAVKDPGSVKHMLFKVSKTSSKSFALEMWPSDIEVQRNRTLSGMKATIQGATKK